MKPLAEKHHAGREIWCVKYLVAKRRVRKTFPTLEEANNWIANNRIIAVDEGRIFWEAWNDIEPKERHDVLEALNRAVWNSTFYVPAALPLMAGPLEKFGPNALLLLALGVVCRDSETRVAAMQAAAVGISSGRLNLTGLADAFSQTITLGVFNPTRLLRSLAEWDRISELHALAAIDFLTTFLLAHGPALPGGASGLMSFLHQSLIRHNRKLKPDEIIKMQALFTGKNQAARLASEIAGLS